MTDSIRAALERLAAVAESVAESANIGTMDIAIAAARDALAAAPEVEPPSWCETDPEQRAWQAGWEARDDVMLRRAALPPSYIDPEHQGEDLELLQTFYAACRAEGGTADEIHLRALRAVLAARPAPPAEGEVAELMAALRADAECIEAGHHDLCSSTADQLTRSAELLGQRYPVSVPVSERPWERPDWCDESGKCWWGRTADEFWNPVWHYATWEEVQEFCSDAMPQVSLPHNALPLPQGEVK